MSTCPACQLGDEHQKPSNEESKSQCSGCGTIYFDKNR